MSLQDEISAKAKEIHTDGYPMSLGEIISLYRDKEMDIHPEFQRFFRWSLYQKTKLIESILLGIPIPSIFVSQREDGVWDVIDGLQRLSTILEFVGELEDENNQKIAPTPLLETEYLPSLKNKKWNDAQDPDNSLTNAQRLDFKRSKLDIKIIKKESDSETKYELFQRLNTGGSALSPQEIRNCLMIMENRDFYEWIKRLSSRSSFQNCIALTEKGHDEQFDLELVLRFIIYKTCNVREIAETTDVGLFITNKTLEFCKNQQFDYQKEESIFNQTFDLLDKTLSDNSFKKYDLSKDRFLGAFMMSAYEVIAVGVAENLISFVGKDDGDQLLIETIKKVWQNATFQSKSGSGSKAVNRLPYLVPLGKEFFHV